MWIMKQADDGIHIAYKDIQAQNYICALPVTSVCVPVFVCARAYEDIQAQNYICAQPDTSVCVCVPVCVCLCVRAHA